MNAKKLQARLHHLFVYTEPGFFVRRINCGRTQAGDVAGTILENGYVQITIDYKHYLAHRLAFVYKLGRWPHKDADHKNRKRNDNRWRNLRDATRGQNNKNSKSHAGVYLARCGLWRARIGKDSKVVQLGYFKSRRLARTAYREAEKELYGVFVR